MSLDTCGLEETRGQPLRDRDVAYGEQFSRQARALEILQIAIATRSRWRNGYPERVIGSMRREVLGHIIVVKAI